MYIDSGRRNTFCFFTISLDDAETYKLLQRGDGLGLFQLESSGMRDLLTRLRPSSIDDLIACLALYRPGPLSSGMVDNFIDCKHGRKQIEYPHLDLKPILENTYGSIVYQEQVMQIAQVMAGYSLGGADLLRRAMGKKDMSVMAEQKTIFVSGAVQLGHTEALASDVFDLLAYFAGYGFNRAHSAAYGIISYQTAWLKTHHRSEFMAALMRIEANNTDKILGYIGDCKQAKINIEPPDINTGVAGFNVPKDRRDTIQFGLCAIKGIGESAINSIVEAREEAGGAFDDFMDCLERIDYRRVNKKVLENLIRCGAFDWTEHPRRALLQGLPGAMSTAQQLQEDKRAGQTSLFGLMPASTAPVRFQVPDTGEWPTSQKLREEWEALGLFITGHPLEAFSDIVPRVTTCPITDLIEQPADSRVVIAGMVSTYRAIRTKRGSKMAFATLEDTSGSIECVFFSKPFSQSQRFLVSEQPLLVHGRLEKKDDAVKLLAESAGLLSEVREKRTQTIKLKFRPEELTDDRIKQLKALLKRSPGGCSIGIEIDYPGQGVAQLAIPTALHVIPDESFMQGLESIFRRTDVPELS